MLLKNIQTVIKKVVLGFEHHFGKLNYAVYQEKSEKRSI